MYHAVCARSLAFRLDSLRLALLVMLLLLPLLPASVCSAGAVCCFCCLFFSLSLLCCSLISRILCTIRFLFAFTFPALNR